MWCKTSRRLGYFKGYGEVKVKIHPYKSEPISVKGTAWCSVAFGDRSVQVEWNIINVDCEPIISGTTAVQLGIISNGAMISALALIISLLMISSF